MVSDCFFWACWYSYKVVFELSVCLSLNEMNGIGLSVNMFLCSCDMQTFLKYLKIMRCQWELWGTNLKEQTGHSAEISIEMRLYSAKTERKMWDREVTKLREISSINHGTVVRNTTYINIYFNNHNSLIKFFEVLVHVVEGTLLITFMCFIYTLTATYGIGNSNIPIWQIMEWMHRLRNLPKA